MFIKRLITAKRTFVLDVCQISLVLEEGEKEEKNKKDLPGTYLSKSQDDSNYYTLIIGDNGIGKTTLLKTLSNSNNFRTIETIAGKKHIISLAKDYQAYFRLIISPSVFDDKTKAYLHKYNSYSQILFSNFLIFLHRQESKVKKLEKLLNLNFSDSIEISFGYISGPDTSHSFFIQLPDSSLLEGFSIVDYVKGIKEESSLGEFMNFSQSCAFSENVFNYIRDPQYVSESVLIKRIVDVAMFVRSNSDGIKEDYCSVPKDKYDEFMAADNNIKLSELSEKDIEHILFLNEAGLLRYNIFCNKQQIAPFPVKLLSTGEQQIMKFFSLLSILPSDITENIFFFYDEPENSLHPKWQIDFVKIFKHVAEDIFQIKNSHFIFATHSPLIVMRTSDIPHSSVVRCYRDEGNRFCSEIIPKEELSKFSVDSLLLDTFEIDYYNQEKEKELIALIEDGKKRREQILQYDPNSVLVNSYKLKTKILESFANLKKQIDEIH